MLHKFLFLCSIGFLALLAASSKAQAWGCRHVGYTHVGPGGVYHVGGTAGYRGYGGYRYGGAYRYGVGGYGAGYGRSPYGGYYYGGYPYWPYYYGGYPYWGYGGARAGGYVRRW